MLNTSKTQNTGSNKKGIPVFNDWPESLFKQPAPKMAYTKASLFHLDGSESEIVNLMPFYTRWMEPYEDAAINLKEYVYQLAKYWLKIKSFNIEFGTILEDGSHKTAVKYNTFEIPQGMVFKGGTKGKWITLEEAREERYK